MTKEQMEHVANQVKSALDSVQAFSSSEVHQPTEEGGPFEVTTIHSDDETQEQNEFVLQISLL